MSVGAFAAAGFAYKHCIAGITGGTAATTMYITSIFAAMLGIYVAMMEACHSIPSEDVLTIN